MVHVIINYYKFNKKSSKFSYLMKCFVKINNNKIYNRKNRMKNIIISLILIILLTSSYSKFASFRSNGFRNAQWRIDILRPQPEQPPTFHTWELDYGTDVCLVKGDPCDSYDRCCSLQCNQTGFCD